MKRFLFFLFSSFVLISCKKEVEVKEPLYPTTNQEVVISDQEAKIALGKKLFNGIGQCISCHKPNQKIIGPSISDIVRIYSDNKSDMVSFLKGELDPIVDPSQFQVMKTNLEITKQMTDQELEAIVEYMNSVSVN